MKPETTATGVSREAAAGLVLLGAAILALIIANSSYSDAYNRALELPLSVGIAPLVLSKSILHWINDALMVIFFFVVGLEIKREMSARRVVEPQGGPAAGDRRVRRHDRACADLYGDQLE